MAKKGKTPYSAKIEKKLAQIHITPANLLRSRFSAPQIEKEFEMFDASGKSIGLGIINALRYNPNGQICDLCGHNPIMRIFGVRSKTNGRKLEVGSECIKNWVGADLAAGLASILDAKKNSIVYEERLEDEIAVLEAIIKDPAEVVKRKGYDYKTRTYIEQEYDSNRKRRARYILDRIRSGNQVPITDSDLYFVCDEMRKAGKSIKINDKHAKLLKAVGRFVKKVENFYSGYVAVEGKKDYESRDKNYWTVVRTCRNFLEAYKYAENDFDRIGKVKQTVGKELRKVEKDGKKYFTKLGINF